MTSDGSVTFAPDRTHVLAVVLMVGIALIGISWAPQYLAWVLVFPLAFLIWVFKAKTRVGDRGIDVTYLFKRNVSLSWEDIEGVSFEGMAAKANTVKGQSFTLPGVTFNSLPALSEASGGRITDVITEASEAADGMMEVTDHEGYSVLMTADEYQRHVGKPNDQTVHTDQEPSQQTAQPETKE